MCRGSFCAHLDQRTVWWLHVKIAASHMHMNMECLRTNFEPGLRRCEHETFAPVISHKTSNLEEDFKVI